MNVSKYVLNIVVGSLALTAIEGYLIKLRNDKKKSVSENELRQKLFNYFNKINAANKLVNEESNRLISWSLAIIGGTILLIISTSYIHPKGYILYSYFLFAIGWGFLATSIYYGEVLTRIYIAGITTSEIDRDGITQIGQEVDIKFGSQIKFFKYGILTFSVWLTLFLFWYILLKK
ncbi:MAG: hypothetical protein JWN56_1031 [Sphingobacteriales bacterium]|nr:hypothetical protein [Sphingobacteriales bacterium]